MAQIETSLFEKFKETAKHGIVFGIGAVLQKTISFILLPLYTTRFSVSEYGVLGLITITSSVIIIIFTLGVNFSLFRSYYDYDSEEKRKAVISTAFFLILIFNSILLIFGILFSESLSNLIFDSPEFKIHLMIIVGVSIFDMLSSIPYVVLRVKKKSLHYILFQALFLIIGLILIIYLVSVRNWGILGVLAGNLITYGISCISLYIYIRREIVFRFLRVEVKKMLLYGLPLIPSSLSVYIFDSTDKYFLNYFTTLNEVGLYNLAYKFGTVISVLFASPIALIWPAMFFSVKDHKNSTKFYIRAVTYIFYIALLLFLAVSLLSKEVIMLLSNEEYWGAYMVIPIISLTYALWSLNKVSNVAITLKRKTQVLAIIFGSGAVINVGLNILLIPRYGMFGAAYATISTFLIMIGTLLYYCQKLMRARYEWVRILKILLVSAIIFIIGWFVVIDNLTISIIFKIIIISLYPFLLLLFKFYTKAELQRAREFFRDVINKIKKKLVKSSNK